MSAKHLGNVDLLLHPQYNIPTLGDASDMTLWHLKGVNPMHFALPPVLRGIFGSHPAHDEHLLAGADEEFVQALGVSQPVLARFRQDVAILCPDLVHEAQLGLGRM